MPGSDLLPSSARRPLDLALAVRTLVQATAFWTGVLLPLAHVPLLVLVEVDRVSDAGLVFRLVAANAIACLVGHGHDPSGVSRDE